MIADDIELAHYLHSLVDAHPELQAISCRLSITTFRYVPPGTDGGADQKALDRLNEALLEELQRGGEAYVSNAVVDGRFALRACIVNFRTSRADLERLVDAVVGIGRRLGRPAA